MRRHPLSAMLAIAVLRAQDLEVVPALVLASRYACWELEPSGDLDVLPDAAAALLDAYMTELTPAQAARAVLIRFRECKDQDRLTVTSAVLSSHVEHQRSVLPAPGLAKAGGVPRIARTRTALPTRADARRAADALSAIGARQVLLFGSVAQGDPNLESDIDLVAVFDDLGDYRRRQNIETQARRAVEDACGWASDILITDRVEWSVRSKLHRQRDSDDPPRASHCRCGLRGERPEPSEPTRGTTTAEAAKPQTGSAVREPTRSSTGSVSVNVAMGWRSPPVARMNERSVDSSMLCSAPAWTPPTGPSPRASRSSPLMTCILAQALADAR